MSSQLPTVLVTGASSGIGAVYADRFARRGHDLVLVARDEARLHALAERLRRETGGESAVGRAAWTDPVGGEMVEPRWRAAPRIGVLVNNAGAALFGSFADQ